MRASAKGRTFDSGVIGRLRHFSHSLPRNPIRMVGRTMDGWAVHSTLLLRIRICHQSFVFRYPITGRRFGAGEGKTVLATPLEVWEATTVRGQVLEWNRFKWCFALICLCLSALSSYFVLLPSVLM